MCGKLDLLKPLRRAAVEDLTSLLARGWAHVDDPVGVANHVELVLHDEERIAGRLEPIRALSGGLGVGRMKPGRRLVEHIHDAEQVRPHLGGQPQPLQFAGR